MKTQTLITVQDEVDISGLDLLDNRNILNVYCDVMHINTTSNYTIISLHSCYPSYISLSVLEKKFS